MSLLPWKEAEIIEMEAISSHLKRIQLRFPEGRLNFKPGQFITIDLPIHERPNKRWRSYSIAECSETGGTCELMIERVPDGPATTYLFEHISIGETLKCRGPQGNFVLDEHIDQPIMMIADGIGIVPFRSMLQALKKSKNKIPPITLLYFTGSLNTVLYETSLAAWKNEIPGFSYILHKENIDSEVVHTIIERSKNEEPGTKFYLCGWRAAVDLARQVLTTLEIPQKDIHIELFG